MVKRTGNSNDNEPEQKKFDLPSEKEHLFQVSDIFTMETEVGKKLDLDADTVSVKCEVCGGEEEGRTLLIRLSLDDDWKGFFATRLFLKAIGEPYKGKDFPIDTDNWQARQFYATVIHKDNYANIKEYNFEKKIDQAINPSVKKAEGELAWDE